MAINEFEKVFLEIDGAYRPHGEVFGSQWDEVRSRQIKFLLERPLMFKTLTEKFLGPAKLISLGVVEWSETEQEVLNMDKRKQVDELADMTLLLITSDSLNPNLLFPSQRNLIRLGWKETVNGYCLDAGINNADLTSACVRKIKINELRNPPEAFILVRGEDIETSGKRMDHNWQMLKAKRGLKPKLIKKADWWKSTLYIDDGGWVRENN